MNQYLQFLREIKSVAFATMDNDRPAVRIADVMLVEDDKLFFLVPRGKAFYKQLRKNPCLSLAGMDADCTECGICAEACPENCISPGTPYEIEKNCIECGRCYEQCPAEAIEPPFSFRYN